MGISGLDHAASAPALLRFALRVATRAQGWLPAGWLAFAERVSNPLDHSEQFIRSSSSPGILTLSIFIFMTSMERLPVMCRHSLKASVYSC
jgi:hypothetical protein